MNGNIAARVQVMVSDKMKGQCCVVLCKEAENTGSAVQSTELLHAVQPQYAD